MVALVANGLAGVIAACSSSGGAGPSAEPGKSTNVSGDASTPSPDSGVDAAHSEMPDADAVTDAGTDATDASVCDAGLTACGQACVDTRTDDNHCGGCGLTCANCTEGECVVAIFADAGVAQGIAVDGNRVYWTDFQTFSVMSAGLDGSDVKVLATGQTYPKGIAVSGDHIYWANAGAGSPPNGSIMRATLDGGSPTAIASGQAAPQLVVVGGDRVFWANAYPDDAGAAAVASVSMSADGGSGNVMTLSTGPEAARGLAVNATNVFWIDGATRRIMSAPFHGTAVPLGDTTASAPMSVAANASRVFWTEYSDNRVNQAPLDGGVSSLFSNTHGCCPVGAIADEQNVYWTEDTGDIVKASLDGGAPRVLASGQGTTNYFLAVDAHSLYWSDGPRIMKVTPK
jgi:hypothetical protein